MSARFATVEQGLRDLRAFRTGELTILRAAPALIDNQVGTPIGPIPLVLTKYRADVADLARLHRLEGDGEAAYTWHFGLHPDLDQPSWALLRVEFIAPAACRFTLAFELAKHRDFLDVLATTESFTLITEHAQHPFDGLGLTGVPVAEMRCVLLAHGLACGIVADLRRKRAA